MEERVLPTREELQELKAQGIVFRSPLATRAVILSAVLITLLFTLKGSTVTGSMPVDGTGVERLARSLLSLVVIQMDLMPRLKINRTKKVFFIFLREINCL